MHLCIIIAYPLRRVIHDVFKINLGEISTKKQSITVKLNSLIKIYKNNYIYHSTI